MNPKPCPSTWSYPLFKHMSDEHGLTLLESELSEIASKVVECRVASTDARVAALEQERDALRKELALQEAGVAHYEKDRDSLAAKLTELRAIAEGLADNIRNRQRSNCPSCGRSRYGNRRSCECGFYFVRYESLAAFTEWKERNP